MPRVERVYAIAKATRRSVWTFPVICLVILLLLTAFKISGSSIGVYYTSLYGDSAHDPDLIYGAPQPIRSDEWKVSTPLTVLQSKIGFPTFNEDLGSGHDIALSQDAPVKNWLGIFRPQNYSFFVLPFEYAYAFRWWIVMYLLLIASYFFILRLLPGRKLLSVILSLAFALSPYFLWWYQAPVFLPFAYAMFAMILGMRIINEEKIPRIKSRITTDVIYTVGLVFLGLSSALLIYAPFLIPAGIVTAAFLLGYLFDKKTGSKISWSGLIKRLRPLGLAMVIIVGAGILFVSQHHEAISRVANSEYPGHRTIQSGDLAYSHLFPYFGGVLMPILQVGSHGINYFANQSEASNFILLLPFLIIPGVAIQVYSYRTSKKISYIFILLQIVAILFLVRITLPVASTFYHFMLLSRVPNTRLIAGIGFVGFLQMLYLIKLIDEVKIRKRLQYSLAAAYGLACFAVLFIFGIYVRHHYPLFLTRYIVLVGLVGLFTSVIFAFLANKKLIGASLLLLFTIGSSFRIMPLYHGASFFYDSKIVKKMESISKPQDNWTVLDTSKYESMPYIAGRGSIGGHQTYADLDLWHQIDKTHKFQYVYNRQGHALFLSNTLANDPTAHYNVTSVADDFELVKSNMFKVKFTCSDFTYKNIQYVLATHTVHIPCLNLASTVSYPKTTFLYLSGFRPPIIPLAAA